MNLCFEKSENPFSAYFWPVRHSLPHHSKWPTKNFLVTRDLIWVDLAKKICAHSQNSGWQRISLNWAFAQLTIRIRWFLLQHWYYYLLQDFGGHRTNLLRILVFSSVMIWMWFADRTIICGVITGYNFKSCGTVIGLCVCGEAIASFALW